MNSTSSAAPARHSTMMQIVPVMFCFFAMGFVDLVGIASNYVQKDLALSNTQTSFLPGLVFFWFLIFSVPTGMLMNRIGRKRTVLISLFITTISLILPLFGDSYYIMLASFSLLGIGNAVMQTSLNPLVSNLISPDKLASTLTFGQFVKAIASALATPLCAWGAAMAIPTFGLGWRVLFAIYAVVSVLSVLFLGGTHIKEERPDKVSGIMECVKLLRKPFILLCFIGIICHVGIDVGVNTYAPQIVTARTGIALEDAGFATMVYFIFRTAGCFLGSFILRMTKARYFFAFSVLLMVGSAITLFTAQTLMGIYVGCALVGFGNSNIFSVVFSQALNYAPTEKNEVSGLMIMGLFGGTIFPLAIGLAISAMGINGAVAVMSVGVAYLALYTPRIKG